MRVGRLERGRKTARRGADRLYAFYVYLLFLASVLENKRRKKRQLGNGLMREAPRQHQPLSYQVRVNYILIRYSNSYKSITMRFSPFFQDGRVLPFLFQQIIVQIFGTPRTRVFPVLLFLEIESETRIRN